MEKWFAKNRKVSSWIFFAQRKKEWQFLALFCPTSVKLLTDLSHIFPFWHELLGVFCGLIVIVKKTQFSNGLQNCSIFVTFDLKSQNWPLPTVIFLCRESSSPGGSYPWWKDHLEWIGLLSKLLHSSCSLYEGWRWPQKSVNLLSNQRGL